MFGGSYQIIALLLVVSTLHHTRVMQHIRWETTKNYADFWDIIIGWSGRLSREHEDPKFGPSVPPKRACQFCKNFHRPLFPALMSSLGSDIPSWSSFCDEKSWCLRLVFTHLEKQEISLQNNRPSNLCVPIFKLGGEIVFLPSSSRHKFRDGIWRLKV